MIEKQGNFQKELHKYEKKNQEESYIIKGKLHGREGEVKALKQKYENDISIFRDLEIRDVSKNKYRKTAN